MAENKQYIAQVLDNGSINISEDVLATIISRAVGEVEGVAGLTSKPGSDIAELIGKKNWGKGMKINIDENNQIAVDCNINVCYGQSVVAVANAAQEAIFNALESMIGIRAESVNVNVCGIIRQ